MNTLRIGNYVSEIFRVRVLLLFHMFYFSTLIAGVSFFVSPIANTFTLENSSVLVTTNAVVVG